MVVAWDDVSCVDVFEEWRTRWVEEGGVVRKMGGSSVEVGWSSRRRRRRNRKRRRRRRRRRRRM